MTTNEICSLRSKISQFLKINNLPFDEDSIDDYVYKSAQKELMLDMYGDSPSDNDSMQNKPVEIHSHDGNTTDQNKEEKEQHSITRQKIKISKI